MKGIERVFGWISALGFLLFVTEIMLGGAGEMAFIFGLGIRKAIFLSLAISCILLKIVRFASDGYKYKNCNWPIVLISCTIFAIWVLLLPLLNGQGIRIALKDAGPLIGAAVIVALFDEKVFLSYWRYIRIYIFSLLIIFVLSHVALYVVGLNDPNSRWVRSDMLKEIWDPSSSIINQKFVFFGPNAWGPRIYFGSSFLLLIGLYFSFFFNGEWPPIKKIGLVVLFFLGIVITQTRSLILASLIFIFLIFVADRSNWPKKKNDFYLWLLIGLPLVFILVLIPSIEPRMLASAIFYRGEAENIRQEQMLALIKDIGMFPFLGKGFGSHVAYIRNLDTPYAYELSVVALYMKMGVIGIIAVITLIALYGRSAINGILPGGRRLAGGTYALYCAIVVASFYNPYLFSFFGTFFIIFICLETKYLSMMAYGNYD